MQLNTDQKAQSAVETMLMIAAAVIIAVVVGLYLKSIPTSIENTVNNQSANILNQFG